MNNKQIRLELDIEAVMALAKIKMFKNGKVLTLEEKINMAIRELVDRVMADIDMAEAAKAEDQQKGVDQDDSRNNLC